MIHKKQIKMTSSGLAKSFGTKFPTLRKELQKCGGWIYSEAAVIAEFINDSIRSGDHATVDQAIALAESTYENGDGTVRNAFYCEFFEILDLRSKLGAGVFLSMNKEFQDAYVKAQAYIGTPFGTSRT
jgi:hypothetical protein